MTINRSAQLAKIRTLYELRERESLAKLSEQKKRVVSLKKVVENIQACIDGFENQLKTLDDRRLHVNRLTVEMLHDDAANRLIVQRDLSKERIYLDTAIKDVSNALEDQAASQLLWRECSKRLDALTTLSQNQEQILLQQTQVISDRELDDLALSRYGLNAHG